MQTVQDQNIEIIALVQDEICLTQESVERIKEDTSTHISYMLERIYTLEDATRFFNSEVLTTIFFNLRNFTCHELAHCTHTLFVPPFTPIETLSFQ